MTDPVFFVPALPPAGRFELGGDEGRHAATVKRLRAGERLVLSDGAGAWAPATVASTAARSLILDVGVGEYDDPPTLRVVLVQALPKGERSDLAVDLATETGIDEIVPWQAERCVARWNASADKADKGRAKWARVAREAAKQSRRRRIPPVAALAGITNVAERVARADAAFLLHEEGALSLAAAAVPTAGEIVLIVGPEGGLTPTEIDRLTAAGARAVRLGPEVLRTSTAAAVALGALAIRGARWS